MTRNKEIPSFFGQIKLKGEKLSIEQTDNKNPQQYYKHENGELWFGDSIKLRLLVKFLF